MRGEIQADREENTNYCGQQVVLLQMESMTAYGKFHRETTNYEEEIHREVQEGKQRRAKQLAAVRARRREYIKLSGRNRTNKAK